MKTNTLTVSSSMYKRDLFKFCESKKNVLFKSSLFHIVNLIFGKKYVLKKYEVKPQYLVRTDFLIDFKNKEVETSTASHDYNAIIIVNFLLKKL